jgi:hypothetical protein
MADENNNKPTPFYKLTNGGLLTDDDIALLQSGGIPFIPIPTSGAVQVRTNIEIVAAIRKFDKTSGELAIANLKLAEANVQLGEKLKKLTFWGVLFAAIGAFLALIGLILGAGSLLIAYWTYQVSLPPGK